MDEPPRLRCPPMQRRGAVVKDAPVTRRRVLGMASWGVTSWGVAAGSFASRAAGAPSGASEGEAGGASLEAPSGAPVVLKVMDAAGSLRQTQPAFEAYRRAKPDAVSRLLFAEAPAAKLPGRLKAQQEAGGVEFDLVLAGPTLLSAGTEQELWLPLLPEHARRLPDLRDVLSRPAWAMQDFARGQGVVVSYCPSGPLLQYMPERVGPVPTTAEELLAWARAHPKRFVYAHPARSDAGRSFLLGLPYLLGDADPKDPERGWDKTWTYLRELGTTIEHYPPGNHLVRTGLIEGARDMIASTTGLDVGSRVVDGLPREAEIALLRGLHWVGDAHYAAVPRGVPDAKLAVLLDLIGFLLTKEAQAFTYGVGSFYPGPAVAGVTLDMAPRRIRDRVRAAERPHYEGLIADYPAVAPLDAGKLAYAFRRWEEQVGTVTAR